MFDTAFMWRYQHCRTGSETARIDQTIEAARCSLDRLARLRQGWDSLNPEARGLGPQTEIISETAIACAYARDLTRMMSRTYRGMICVPRWDDELAEIRQEVADAAAWMHSVGIPWPRA